MKAWIVIGSVFVAVLVILTFRTFGRLRRRGADLGALSHQWVTHHRPGESNQSHESQRQRDS